MERARHGEKFRSAHGKHKKEFEFDYLFCCFFDANNEPFPNKDDHQHRVMCGLAALHTAAALSHQRILLNDGTNLEYMFLPALWILHQQSGNDEYPHPEALQGGVVLCPNQM